MTSPPEPPFQAMEVFFISVLNYHMESHHEAIVIPEIPRTIPSDEAYFAFLEYRRAAIKYAMLSDRFNDLPA